ncbi:MAG: hypothetical protein O7I42_23065, partial [Alphaproteobacteria bacterium]|nr:hypothetical protein [Alphaproteobacteria bacterium]
MRDFAGWKNLGGEKRTMSVRNWILATSLLFLLGGCAGDRVIPIKPALDRPPLVDSLPLTMGVYFGPELRGYAHREPAPAPPYLEDTTFVFPLGPPSAAMFELVFTGVFAKTVPVERPPSAARRRADVAAIIETKIEQVSATFPTLRSFEQVDTLRIPAEITYRFIVYTAKGETIASWTVTG